MAKRIVIIGGGPAGLAAAHTLASSKESLEVVVIEASPMVGGLSKTVRYKDYHFDIGGHRFYTKSEEVKAFWKSILPESEFLVRKRRSSLYFNKIFLTYPLKPLECLFKLPFFISLNVVFSYLSAQLIPWKRAGEENLESWMQSRMGDSLYKLFFKSYTEKVWGTHCRNISADWARQRINDLSLGVILKKFLFLTRKTPKSIISSYHYPKQGPGQMWESCYKKCLDLGVKFHFKTSYKEAKYVQGSWLVKLENEQGEMILEAHELISSIALPYFCRSIDSGDIFPQDLLAKFNYRDFSTVVFMGEGKCHIKEQWIYIQDDLKKCGRVQFYHNWSPHMVPNENNFSIGLEYFHGRNDISEFLDDEKLINVAEREIRDLGLINQEMKVCYTEIFRANFAYPIYHLDYRQDLIKVREILDDHFKNIHLIGRNGMHRYNNQDHSILTGIICAENIISGKFIRDPFKVNQDAIYIEEHD